MKLPAVPRIHRIVTSFPLFTAAILLNSSWSNTCLAEDTAIAWGNNNNLQATVPPSATNVAALAAGAIHSLALRVNGTVAGWGDNSSGQANMSGLANVMAIAAGDTFSLALSSNGTVAVRGALPPSPVPLTNITAIAAGWNHGLALKQDGTLIAWGDTNPVPAGLSNVVAIAAGDGNSLALLNDSTVTAWGNPAFDKTLVPTGLTNVVAIAAGKDHCLALKQNGQLIAWGRNDNGQTNVPVGLSNVVAISAGALHSTAMRANGTVAAWGNNIFNQSSAPGLAGFRQISAGGYHNLGLLGDNSPAITLQPRSQAVPINQDVTFVVLAAGPQPMTFQWRKNGTNLVGKTSNVLSLSNIQSNDAAVYSVRVANSNGVVTSIGAILTPFLVPPRITSQPEHATTVCGQDAEFQVSAEGYQPLGYQWLFENTPVEGATSTNLVLTNVTVGQAGGYSVVVTNLAGSVTSIVATLTVNVVPPLITVEPMDTNVICGGSGSFDVTAQGPNPLTYQWYFEGMEIAWETNASLILSNVTTAQAGGYYVVAFDQCASVTSIVSHLTVQIDPPVINSQLQVFGAQGTLFSYSITALRSPIAFTADRLPLGLSLDPATGIIAGTPLETGVFTPTITAINLCGSHSETLTLTFSSGKPVITSPLILTANENTNLTYQITATGGPESFAALNLPDGLILNPVTGEMAGAPVFPGTHRVLMSASNQWGVGTAPLSIFVTNRTVDGLSIADITYTYSSPYLLDFEFTLLDTNGNGIITDPAFLSAVCMENTHPGTTNVTWPDDEPNLPTATQLVTNLVSESGVFFVRSTGSGGGKVSKTYLVLDYSASISDPFLNGDSNGDGISDAVDYMTSGAHYFINQQPVGSQVGVFEFHRDDEAPNQVSALTDEKALLNEAIDGIWTNYVNWFYAGSRCWDAVNAAILALGSANPDEQRAIIFISDGRDSSSIATVEEVIDNARAGDVRVYCIAFGNNPDLATLSDVTWATGGRLFDAQTQVDLLEEFTQVTKNVLARYTLRWASLRRNATEVAPFFLLSYQGHTATPAEWSWSYQTNMSESYVTNTDTTIDTSVDPPVTNITTTIETNMLTDISVLWENPEIGEYVATNYAGPVTVGTLRLMLDEEVQPTGVALRAGYIPRFVRQIRLHYRPNWPCQPVLNATNVGEMLHGWSLTQSNDVDGSAWLLLHSPNPQNTATSLPFPGFGPLLTFSFQDILTNATEAFALMEVDNSIYTNIPAGGQQFVFEAGVTNFVTDYPALPFGTPVPWLISHGISGNFAAAELTDHDGDGVPTWQEYLGNTNPQDPASKFVVRSLSNDIYGRYQITFSTATNRRYRVEASFDLINWEIVETDIAGLDSDVTILDPRYQPWITQVFYRAVVY